MGQDKAGPGYACIQGYRHQEGQVSCYWQVSTPVFPRQHSDESLVADLSAQSLISLHLQAHFEQDEIIGEEDTSELRQNEQLREKVVGLVNGAFVGEGWGEGKSFSEDE